MAKIGEARSGEQLRISKERIDFSLWPVCKPNKRFTVQHRIFTANPWPVIADAIKQNCPQTLLRPAGAFCAQAEDFFEASLNGRVLHAKPLLLYYSMLNLAKAFILTSGQVPLGYRPGHGISERATEGQIAGAKITAHPHNPSKPQLFSDFLRAVCDKQIKKKREYRLGDVLPQVLPGHRLWCSASGSKERFVGVDALTFLTDTVNRSIWIRLVVERGVLSRLAITHEELLVRTGLGSAWRIAKLPDQPDLLCLERKVPVTFGRRPSDVVMEVVDDLRHSLWLAVQMVPPFAQYYLYAAPPNSRANVLPQLLSMYLVMFFLGSITRYRPHHFERLLESPYGAHIEGMLNEVPTQFLYLLASTFLKREVVKAAIV